jgi:flagella basal body P-ring formation protein FlgA
MMWGVYVVLLLFAVAGCTTDSSSPELIGVESVPTQRHYYTPTPNGSVNVAIQTAILIEEPEQPSSTSTEWAVYPSEQPDLWKPIVIITKPIPAGYAIPPDAIRLEMWSVESLPTGHYLELEQVINQVTLVDLTCHEPVLARTIAPRQVGTGFLPLPNDCEENPHSQTASYVVIAARDIQAGETITPASVQRILWHYAPQDSFVNLADVIGSRAKTYIFREQILTTQRIIPPTLEEEMP